MVKFESTTMNKNFILLALIISVIHFGIGTLAFAQTKVDEKKAAQKVGNIKKQLEVKLLLSHEQRSSLDSIVTESVINSINKQNKHEKIQELNGKIEGILTPRQKTKFEIIKSNWLVDVLELEE